MEQYAKRRYGLATPPSATAAWQTLAATVYSCLDGAVDHVRQASRQSLLDSFTAAPTCCPTLVTLLL